MANARFVDLETCGTRVSFRVQDEPVVAETRNAVKEEDRLAITVKRIDDDGHIVPRGFFYKSPDGKVVKAPYFKG